MEYSDMTMEQLFQELRDAAIADYDLRGDEALLSARNAAIDRETAVLQEIKTRPGYLERLRTLLDDPHPRLRLRGAMSLKESDPITAMRTFKDLKASKSSLGGDALIQIFQLRKLGVPG